MGQKGVAVTPYGITRVTANGAVIYQHEVDTSHVLVAPYVAAQMTDLLQTAVATGSGHAAQIGRPVAGKTGTTSSNKDGWFIGFSSGLTTGVWMGRDDAKVVPGLQGGTAPARAFAAFMTKAVAKRPVEQFDTQVTLPEWQLEPEDNAYYAQPDNGMRGHRGGESREILIFLERRFRERLHDLAVLLQDRLRHDRRRRNNLVFLSVDCLDRNFLVHETGVKRGCIRKCASAKSHSREGRGAWHELHYASILCGWRATDRQQTWSAGLPPRLRNRPVSHPDRHNAMERLPPFPARARNVNQR